MDTLDIRGPRGGLTAEKARELAADALVGTRDNYRRVILSTWALSVESAEVLAEAMANMPNLEAAILADIIAGRPEAEGLAVYRTLGTVLKDRHLKEIDLSDNAVGPKGVDACRAFIAGQERLESMMWCNCGISAEAARSIADLLLFRTPTVLRTLHFFNNMSGNGGAIAIADIVRASPQLRDFRFSSSRGGGEGGVALAMALRHATALERLDLNDNTFGVRGGVSLGATLRGAKHLRHLNVGDIALEDEGAAALVSGLVRGCAGSLETLNLAANDLTQEGAKAVARCIRRCTRLRVIDLSENPEMGNLGARIVARAITRRAAFLAAAGEEGKDTLEELLISGSDVGNAGALAIARAVAAALPRLRRLVLADNERLTAAGVKAVQQALGERSAILEGVDDVTGEDDDEEEDDEDALEADDEESDIGEDDVAVGAPGAVEGDLDAEVGAEKRQDSEVDAVSALLSSSLEL